MWLHEKMQQHSDKHVQVANPLLTLQKENKSITEWTEQVNQN